MIDHSSPENLTVHEAGPSNKELADFVFQSFYFSQGHSFLQESLIDYGRAFYGDRLTLLTPLDREEIRAQALKKALSWTVSGPHSRLNEEAVAEAVENEIYEFETIFSGADVAYLLKRPPFTSAVDAQTCKMVIEQDYHWLLENSGRPGRHESSAHSELKDPYLSHIIYYGLLGRDARNPVMNQTFLRIRRVLLEGLSGNPVVVNTNSPTFFPRKKFNEVLTVYLEHHPAEQAEIERVLSETEGLKLTTIAFGSVQYLIDNLRSA